MSKKNGKGPDLNEIEVVQAYKDEKLSSGVVVRILPFPARLHDTLQSRAFEKFPEPVPPKKIVKVAGGTEETDNFNDPDYLKQKASAEKERESWKGRRVGETVIDFCIQVDLDPYEHIIKKFEKSLDEEAPIDPDERRSYFLTNYALRGRADYERVTTTSLTLMAVGDREVAERIKSFRSEMARAGNIDIEAPSPDETVGMDLVNSEAGS